MDEDENRSFEDVSEELSRAAEEIEDTASDARAEEATDPISDEEPEIAYPSVEDVLEIHAEIIEDDENAEPGVRNRGSIEYTLETIQGGPFGSEPKTIHEKAYQLMRLIAANHPFVDGNKRTALHSTVYFYFWNGRDLEYNEELESMLILLSIREDFIDETVAVDYLESITEAADITDLVDDDLLGLGILLVAILEAGKDLDLSGDGSLLR